MSTPILATKLYLPPARSETVARPRLIARLNEGAQRKLTLISAPAGFGKTTLVSEWIAAGERPSAWLSLDERDSDLTRFLAYVVAALRTIAPACAERVREMLESSPPLPADSILTTLLNEIAAIPNEFTLVLDDYHLVGAQPVDQALAFMLEHLPPQMHLIITTREDPQLPLPRLRVRRQLTELRAADLRFTVEETAVAHKPANISFAQAAAVPMTAVTALQGLRDYGQIQAGQKVMVNGASGGVGTFAVQLAKAMGADVTAVVSTQKMNMARSLGADHVIDYTREVFSQNGQQYDLLFDTAGNRSVSEYRQALAPRGIFVTSAFLLGLVFQRPWRAITGGQQMSNMIAEPNKADLLFLAELLKAEQITPVIDKCYPLNEAAEALHYLGEGHAKGKIIIVMPE